MDMHQQLSIEIKVVDVEALDMPEIKALYRACKWDWLEPDTEMFSAFQNSWRLFVATSGDKVIGFARIVSDGKIYGLLTDFIVSPEHRRKGYGQELARMVVEQCEQGGLRVIQLLASREGFSVYKRAGFTKCPELSPGMIKFL
jgi:ribosomal protein S18 acetylase RimI-like enzyme